MAEQGLDRRRFLKIMMLAGASAAFSWGRIPALAAAVPRREDHPVVVIGSGLGGLVAAAYLARNGFPVTVLERHERPGGYATSFQRAEGRFTFEVSLHASVVQNGPPQQILQELGLWDRIRLADQPEFARIHLPNLDLDLPAKNPEKVKDILAGAFPSQTEGLRRFIDEMVQVQKEMTGAIGPAPVMPRLEKITLAQWLDQYLTDPQAKAVLSVLCGYYGLPPSRLNALYYAVATGQYLVHGGQYYQNRSQDLSDTLVEAIEAHGGRVLTETGARRILVEHSVVIGAEDETGQTHPARAVIANAGAPMVFGSLLPKEAVPADFLKRVENGRPSLSSFVVWLGLNQSLRGKTAGYEHFIQTGEDPERQYQTVHAGDLERASIGVTIYDNLFEGYSPPGASTVTVMSLCGYDHWRKYEADYLAGRKDAYNAEKERLARILIEKAERTVLPGLSGMIEVMDAATPLTNIRYTSNPDGAIYGYELNPTGTLRNLEVATPVKGLYLASAWTHGGGFTPAMMAGREAASTLLSDWGDTAS